MARIPYPTDETLASEPLVQRIMVERGSLLNLYRMLLHSPPLAEGWLSFFTAIRQKCSLPGKIREMVIMRIASIHNATYEFSAHEPFALQEGITPDQINSLRAGSDFGFDVCERAILAYCESMTHEVEVPDAVFETVKAHFNEREFVELTATIAGYNLVSRFLEAMQIDHEPAIAES
ncbi:carboxymuconolactone decarboxylase family protein [Candidimonas sp. SYP-B2681]|uniref:carboxymuconolactone decarboxylase family protein n=1 Tax=Candidimonas sp. SYP-B2681 TaxID=2497686 RepID=UPI000F8610B8|nr:carboxymuconolactone decarboxylase family protein [Candidimonas sp. SYP-B2681]RTZ48218.1 carboxymuconolactone decarboxylase family protein [Candidimonas sp. SYP-B2681]